MNKFLNALKKETNYTWTENGALTHPTSGSDLLDMFALAGSMRNRSDEDCILMFRLAFKENPLYALKCLFYTRDREEGCGERRFFKVCLTDLAKSLPEVVERNLENVVRLGRWDDLYCLVDTPAESAMWQFMKKQFALDLECQTPSLLGKWLKSCNTSSQKSRELGNRTRIAFDLTHKQYRKSLSLLRERINVVERLMSAGQWDRIEFDKIPSRAGFLYRNAFAKHDIERQKAGAITYEQFAKSEDAKVNAKVLTPVEIAHEAFCCRSGIEDTKRLMLQKYWDNLEDFYQGREENGIAVCDVSGSMSGQPMEAAVAMSAYIAERGKGPFANHFITFSKNPQLVRFEGLDIVDKMQRCKRADWGYNTNIEKVFDLLLQTALKDGLAQEDLPSRIYIFSDMMFDMGFGLKRWNGNAEGQLNTLMEAIRDKWASYGFKMPSLVFWNLDARDNQIPAIGSGFSYVSGFSMAMVSTILSGRDGWDLMMAKLDDIRYSDIK